MPRGPRLDAPGCLHHVIARGIERRAIFLDDADRLDFVDRLAGLAVSTRVEVLAWALLPNHFHLLLRTGELPLSALMRRLNTGYAVRFNRRHERVGYLFQNRFKSFLVEEEPYLVELVRYIHLNPLRAGVVDALERLDSFPWSGHSALLGHITRTWQATRSALLLFGCSETEARAAYREFVAAGAGQASPPDLTGGGLHPSHGAWLTCGQQVRGREQWAADERVLGSDAFVAQVLREQTGSPPPAPLLLNPAERNRVLSELLHCVAARCGVSAGEIASSSRQPLAVRGRTLLARLAVNNLAMSLNAVARFLGVTRQSIRRALERPDEVPVQFGHEADLFLDRIRCRRGVSS